MISCVQSWGFEIFTMTRFRDKSNTKVIFIKTKIFWNIKVTSKRKHVIIVIPNSCRRSLFLIRAVLVSHKIMTMDAACWPAPAGVNHPAAYFLIITSHTSFKQLVKQETFNSQDTVRPFSCSDRCLDFWPETETQLPPNYYSDKISKVKIKLLESCFCCSQPSSLHHSFRGIHQDFHLFGGPHLCLRTSW